VKKYQHVNPDLSRCKHSGSFYLACFASVCKIFTAAVSQSQTGADPGGAIGAVSPLKTYKSNFFHNDFLQFGKQHSRYKAIFTSIVLPQQCCEVYFMSLAVVNS